MGKSKFLEDPSWQKDLLLFKSLENKDRIEQDNRQDAQVGPFLYNK